MEIDVLNEIISEILSQKRTFYDVLVIFVDNLLDEDSKLAFKYFQEISQNNIQQPFISFLTKKENNPNILDLFQFITNNLLIKEMSFHSNILQIQKKEKIFIYFLINF